MGKGCGCVKNFPKTSKQTKKSHKDPKKSGKPKVTPSAPNVLPSIPNNPTSFPLSNNPNVLAQPSKSSEKPFYLSEIQADSNQDFEDSEEQEFLLRPCPEMKRSQTNSKTSKSKIPTTQKSKQSSNLKGEDHEENSLPKSTQSDTEDLFNDDRISKDSSEYIHSEDDFHEDKSPNKSPLYPNTPPKTPPVSSLQPPLPMSSSETPEVQKPAEKFKKLEESSRNSDRTIPYNGSPVTDNNKLEEEKKENDQMLKELYDEFQQKSQSTPPISCNLSKTPQYKEIDQADEESDKSIPASESNSQANTREDQNKSIKSEKQVKTLEKSDITTNLLKEMNFSPKTDHPMTLQRTQN
ncbi:unnamed protein product [Moneuplotes crassus]|uniref:Uncharacterized protein n=1 Tax=Euplotes crassus TaxID=5936 RepID=A0AAD1Y3V2_EUPCR|nr:unnamed protein product [Moneuplotes crassus]